MSSTPPTATIAVAMIIAPDKPRDEEFKIPCAQFADAGFAVTVFSTTRTPVTGMFGGVFKPDQLLASLDVAAFDTIVFVGGAGAQVYLEDKQCHNICRAAVAQNKLLAAICIAPAILARAGVLKGRQATVWPGAKDDLTSRGATYTGAKVTTDGRIITADGPQSAAAFAQAVIATLRSR